jgi:hypothetical protein
MMSASNSFTSADLFYIMMLGLLANSHGVNAQPSSLEILILLDNDLGDFKHFLLLVKLPALSIQVKI